MKQTLTNRFAGMDRNHCLTPIRMPEHVMAATDSRDHETGTL